MSSRLWTAVVVLFGLVLGGCGGIDGSNGEDGTANPANVATVNGYTTQPARIYVDEKRDDWTDLSILHVDPEDDGGKVDLERLWAAHTERHLFLRLEVGRPINLQEENGLTLHLDADNDPATGESTLGLGAELSWTFGDRSGEVMRSGSTQEVGHADIGLTTLPTVGSETFEIALDRSATPGGTRLLRGDTLRIALSNEGDRLPNDDGGLGYILSDAETTLEAPAIDRPAASDVRLLSYNSVNNFEEDRSAIFSEERQPSFRRIFKALGPDVIAFQEVYAQTPTQTDSIENELGLSSKWEWAKRGRDLILGSRYPILDAHAIPGYEEYRSGAFLLDAEAALGTNLLVVNMHPPCCNYGPEDGEPSSDAQRQRVVDGVVAFLRDIKQGKGLLEVEPETPIAVIGDMNFVGSAQQPRTLRTGEIVNTDRFGPSAAPDWDGSTLLDTNPRQTATPMHATWINAESSFPPGRLDYAYVSDHVLEAVHEFVLYTPALSASTLSAYGLRKDDTRIASDHLPVVVDVAAR